jgi:hypothetical protein
MTDNRNRRTDRLDQLTDALGEDILNAPGEELLAEVAEDFGDRRALAMKFDQISARWRCGSIESLHEWKSASTAPSMMHYLNDRTSIGREYFSPAEVFEAIQSLTDVTKTKLLKYATVKAAQTPYEGHDLFHEALTRCLEEGRRRWPKDLPLLKFLGGVIRSIASEWKEVPPSDPHQELDLGDGERNTIARIEADKMIKLFDDDAIAKRIVIGIMSGVRGEELRKSSGLNEIDYESKRKKIRRRIEKYRMQES